MLTKMFLYICILHPKSDKEKFTYGFPIVGFACPQMLDGREIYCWCWILLSVELFLLLLLLSPPLYLSSCQCHMLQWFSLYSNEDMFWLWKGQIALAAAATTTTTPRKTTAVERAVPVPPAIIAHWHKKLSEKWNKNRNELQRRIER